MLRYPDSLPPAALGFPDGVTPHQTTVQRLFRQLDPLSLDSRRRGSEGVAFDGKAQRDAAGDAEEELPFASAAVGAFQRDQAVPPTLTAIAQIALAEYLAERGYLAPRRPLRITPAKHGSGR